MLPTSRREARERALSLLYEADSKRVDPIAVLDDLPVPPDPFVVDLVRGVQADQARIDELISAHAIGWTMDRMPVVDRVLLRLATFELLDRPDIPTGAVISEAVDLAGQYSTDESGRFVNGVLATIAGIARPEFAGEGGEGAEGAEEGEGGDGGPGEASPEEASPGEISGDT